MYNNSRLFCAECIIENEGKHTNLSELNQYIQEIAAAAEDELSKDDAQNNPLIQSLEKSKAYLV